jgi:Bacterial Ig domain
MNLKSLLPVRILGGGLLIFAVSAGVSVSAATIWNGPNISWTKSVATPSDPILPGVVVLTRGGNEVMYNTVTELGPTTGSPADTEWGMGTLANFSTLTYKTMDAIRATAGGNLQAAILNKQMVMHIKSQDIYMSIMFTTWGRFGSGTVAYIRSTAPGGGNPPTVTLTNPVSGAVFAAPASINLRANASGGTVTNVEYFAGTTSLGHATTAPFAVTGNLPSSGSYALKAVATAGGLSGTSSVVNITVVSPTPVTLTPPVLSGGQFSFSYSANVGLRYVVQSSSNLVDWVSLVTNVAAGSSVSFPAGSATKEAAYYRVGRLPNP